MPRLFPWFVSTTFSDRLPPGDAAVRPDAPSVASVPAKEPPPAPPPAGDVSERRIHQRFVARLRGEPCFWALVGEERMALGDLSLKGFALAAAPVLARGRQFDFTLRREGVPDAIRGRAEVVSLFGKGKTASAGCRILRFEDDGSERLRDWLVTHVIRSATVRITEKDAAAIVAGRSLV